jgi:hypothetical protein
MGDREAIVRPNGSAFFRLSRAEASGNLQDICRVTTFGRIPANTAVISDKPVRSHSNSKSPPLKQ